MPPLRNRRFLAAVLFSLALCTCGASHAQPDDKPQVGLFSTLPIYWGEAGELTDLLDPEHAPDWSRAVLEQRFALAPLDALEPETLAGVERLLLAQPRALAPSENVALDDWLRAGGRLLIFADPMLTRESAFAIGDRRRPQDVVLLSPILRRWGLELQFDESQQVGPRWVTAFDGNFPVNLAGRFVAIEPGAPSDCAISDTGIMAQCQVGEGRVTLFADAAIFDRQDGEDTASKRAGSLDALVAAALDF